MRKILTSLLVIGVVTATAFGASRAFFSDTETSTGNVLGAGVIDLTVSSQGSAEGASCNFDESEGGPIFDCSDVKPGDSGESTLTFELVGNPSWACIYVDDVVDSDNGCNDAEMAAESVCEENGDGELDDNLLLTVWIDDGAGGGASCNNAHDGSEEIIVDNQTLSSFNLANGNYVLPVSDTSDGSLLTQALEEGSYCIGVKWSVDPNAGNEVQSDTIGGDLVFYVEQARNNEHFVCSEHFAPNQSVQSLTLENEQQNATGPWEPITTDEIYGTLTWNGDGPEFNYTFSAQGLEKSEDYALIYYADPWPGDNPGKFIHEFTTDGSGNIASYSESVDLGMDLPDPSDANFGSGAKIWLVLSEDYNNGNPSTGPMTDWNPEKYLFEGNNYIHYEDTDN